MRQVLLILVVGVLAALPGLAQQTFSFFPPGTQSYAGYGQAVALDGGFALGGAAGGDGSVGSPGVVHVHYAATGGYLGALRPVTPGASDRFGQDVGAEGGIAVVGADGDDTGGVDAGAAYVFDIATRTQLHRLIASDAAPGDGFGFSVHVRGDHALVGAPYHDVVGQDSGAVYLFDLATGQELMKYVGTRPDERLGQDCAMTDEFVLAGAPFSSVGGVPAVGAAYVFDRATGQQMVRFVPNTNYSFRYYGADVAINDEYAVVAHALDPNGLVDNGVVYLYGLPNFQQLARIGNPMNSFNNFEFGSALAIDDETLVVGARGNTSNVFDAGTLHRFDLTTILQVPPPQTTLRADPGAVIARLGDAVAVDGPRTLGGNGSFSPGYPLGGTFLFGPDGTAVGTTSCFGAGCPCGNDQTIDVGCTNSTGRGALLTGARGGGVAEDDLVLVTQFLPPNAFALTFMGGTLAAPTVLGDGNRCVGGTLYRFVPVAQADGSGTAVLGSAVPGAGIVAHSCSTFGATGCIQAGSTWHFQTWTRDPGGPCGTGSNLSNALSVTFGP